MQLDWLRPLTRVEGPYATATLDASRVDPATSDRPEEIWATGRRHLEQLGATAETLDAMEESALEPSGRGGELTRVICGASGSLLLDLTFPGRPVRQKTSFSAAPHLMPLLRGLDAHEPYAVVRVDRTGADLEMVGITGTVLEDTDVSGDHDVIHKVSAGGMGERRIQTRAEDSWKHNAGEVAQAVDSLVRRGKPAVVFLMGDERAISFLGDQASPDVRERLVPLGTGGRAKGVSREAEAEAIAEELVRRRAARQQQLRDDFEAARGATGRGAEGLEAVVEAVRKAQVDTLLLRDDPTSEQTLHVGEAASMIGLTEQDARQAGASAPTTDRADAALVWSLAATGGSVGLVDDSVQLRDGVAAILRWDDDSTRH
ncbi:hypothetical protein N864_21095 [Intrasporangium chromatireducens Q5-1]|uniref:Peptide chain release factor 1 n=1 Tax=Intrasporangium chromatireducens Q5-1 TaxID=584657 RepID=W9GJQ6_9MICO|nr:Vms1/Ankzf1 family peptidyl-tRNA hydrolase [Intrasporangium chromatireducens]EWT06481.1 hypothetical protein N864_21095 [Intrasporangium chromatireducens Q5-1]